MLVSEVSNRNENRTYPVPLVYGMPCSFAAVLYVSQFRETSSCDRKHLAANQSIPLTLLQLTYPDHDSVRQQCLERDTHDSDVCLQNPVAVNGIIC